ncbi:MAG: hypothetical protein DRP55_08935, partial [Spirochaetes bacterium]
MIRNLFKRDQLQNSFPYLILFLFNLFLFREIVFKGHLLGGTDFISFYLEMKHFLYIQLHKYHSIPFWNPYIFGGMPFLAHFESTIFYPLDLLFWIIRPQKAYGYTMFIHVYLAGIFAYILARSFKISKTGSLITGTIYMCNGYLMAILFLGQMCPVQSYIYLPIIIFYLNKALNSDDTIFYASIAGILWGIQILAGAPQNAFYSFITGIGFLLFHIRLSLKQNFKIIKITIYFFLLGVMLSAIQIIPSFELIQHSVRAALDSYEMVTIGSYPPEGIITTIMPYFFGSYIKNTYWVKDIPWSIPQQNLYIGIVALVLIYFIRVHSSNNKRIYLFFLSLMALSILLALGRYTPIYKIIYYIPGFNRFRAPSKIIALWMFSASILAGKGLDNLFTNINMKKGKIVPLF